MPNVTVQHERVTSHASGTVLSGSWLPSSALNRDTAAIFDEALSLSPAQFLRDACSSISSTRTRLSRTCVACFEDFAAYATARGAPIPALVMDVQALWAKSPMAAAVERQHRSDTPACQQPNLVDWGLGPAGHVSAANRLDHNFSISPQMELSSNLRQLRVMH